MIKKNKIIILMLQHVLRKKTNNIDQFKTNNCMKFIFLERKKNNGYPV